MNEIAERYVRLVLAMGQHDPAYVDSYYGPPDWKAEAEKGKRPLAEIDADAQQLVTVLNDGAVMVTASSTAATASSAELARLRHEYLRRQLEALRARVR